MFINTELHYGVTLNNIFTKGIIVIYDTRKWMCDVGRLSSSDLFTSLLFSWNVVYSPWFWNNCSRQNFFHPCITVVKWPWISGLGKFVWILLHCMTSVIDNQSFVSLWPNCLIVLDIKIKKCFLATLATKIWWLFFKLKIENCNV